MRFAALRRALLPGVAVAAAVLSAAPAASAQTVGAYYAPSCGPGLPCSLVRFQLVNPTTTTLLFNTLTLTATSAPFGFAPAAGGVALYQAVDAVGPFGGTGTVAAGGAQFAINFLVGSGFPFELDPHTGGYVEVALTQASVLTGAAFTFSGTLDGGQTVSGSVAVIPEPATVALVGGGLALVGFVARQRHRGGRKSRGGRWGDDLHGSRLPAVGNGGERQSRWARSPRGATGAGTQDAQSRSLLPPRPPSRSASCPTRRWTVCIAPTVRTLLLPLLHRGARSPSLARRPSGPLPS